MTVIRDPRNRFNRLLILFCDNCVRLGDLRRVRLRRVEISSDWTIYRWRWLTRVVSWNSCLEISDKNIGDIGGLVLVKFPSDDNRGSTDASMVSVVRFICLFFIHIRFSHFIVP